MQPLLTQVVNAAVEKFRCMLFRINKNRTFKHNGLFKNNEEKEYPAVRVDRRGKPTPLAQTSQPPLNWSPCLALPLSSLASKHCGEIFPKCVCEPPHVLLTAHRPQTNLTPPWHNDPGPSCKTPPVAFPIPCTNYTAFFMVPQTPPVFQWKFCLPLCSILMVPPPRGFL